MTNENDPARGPDGAANSSVASGTNDAKTSTPSAADNVWLQAIPACVHDDVTRLTPWNPGREHLMRMAALIERVYVAASTSDVCAIGIAPPAPDSRCLEYRVVFQFRSEPGFSAQFIRIPEGLISDELAGFRLLCRCPVVWGQPWNDGGAT